MTAQVALNQTDKMIPEEWQDFIIYPPKADVSMHRSLRVSETVKKFLSTLARHGKAAISVDGHGDMIQKIKDELRGSQYYRWKTMDGLNGSPMFVCNAV